MIGRGLFLLTMLSSCVLSLPVTSGQLENEDVKVMKCIVEALADVLSRPRLMPVSQDCLVTLKTVNFKAINSDDSTKQIAEYYEKVKDDRLVTILRHHNFLKELQEIAVQGDQERAELQEDAHTPTALMPTLQTTDYVADRSMLEALGGPGERSILSQKKRTGNGDEKEEKDGSMEDNEDEGMQVKRENDESPGSHVSESVDEWRKSKAEKREEEEEYDEKRTNSQENSEEEHVTKDDVSEEKRDAPRRKLKEKKSDDVEEKDKRSDVSSHKHGGKEEEGEEMKRGSRESLKQWTKRTKSLPLKKKAVGKEQEQEVPHHSKEVMEDEEGEEKKKRGKSPEERELQMIARRTPEDRRGLEEEGSASRKSEEPEIESLAAIESELENVAQKLHEMRRG